MCKQDVSRDFYTLKYCPDKYNTQEIDKKDYFIVHGNT